MTERDKEQVTGKGLPGRGKGGCKVSEAGKFEEKQGSHCALTVGEAGGVRDEAGEMGWSHVEGAL